MYCHTRCKIMSLTDVFSVKLHSFRDQTITMKCCKSEKIPSPFEVTAEYDDWPCKYWTHLLYCYYYAIDLNHINMHQKWFQIQLLQNQRPLGVLVRLTHSKWNHWILQLSLSQAIISPNSSLWQKQYKVGLETVPKTK